VARLHQRGLVLLADDVHAQLDALVADEHGRSGNELAHLVLALATERAVERVLGVSADLAHPSSPSAVPGLIPLMSLPPLRNRSTDREIPAASSPTAARGPASGPSPQDTGRR